MSGQNVIPLRPNRPMQAPVIADGIIAMVVFVIFEAMMFAGLVGVFMLTRAAAGGAWPPEGQPQLPLGETALNTVALLASGALVLLAGRAWREGAARAGHLLTAAISLGAFFVIFQGFGWVSLISEGPTLISSQHGKFFCLIVAMHGLHALGALIFMGVAWRRLRLGSLGSTTFSAARIFWYFVVGVWPGLYVCLYL